jgi:hypothetical protein
MQNAIPMVNLIGRKSKQTFNNPGRVKHEIVTETEAQNVRRKHQNVKKLL